MATKKNASSSSKKPGSFRITGQIQREQTDRQPGELKLTAYVFDKAGHLLGSSEVDGKGNYNVAVKLARPADVELLVGPADMSDEIRSSSAYRKSLSAKDWKGEGDQFRLKFDASLPFEIWYPWWPTRICVSGHVRKVSHQDDGTEICAVPFVKVEIFDVDREFCLWPYIRDWWKVLLDRPVIRLPELQKKPPFPPEPFPGPDPVPDINLGPFSELTGGFGTSPLERIALNPQPLPPRSSLSNPVSRVSLNPQPEPPSLQTLQTDTSRVGEARLIDSSIASRLEKLTVTSKIAPWIIFPGCFYSKVKVCETTTDCNGYFNCCFKWWPFHFRNGRLRYDSRPDIIIRVTQVINGVPTVIYLDPYTSTRWNVTNAHIDLFLDNEEIVCSHGNCYDPEPGSPVFFTRIGDDEVYKINQASGLYNEGALANVAYGGNLLVYGQFGDDLTSGSPARYYRLSYARNGTTDFTPITASLSDTRVSKSTLNGESHPLGPQTVNGVPALYEVRDFSDYYWYNPDWLGTWYTKQVEPDTDKYILRLEVFDQNGNKLTTAMGVDYRNGAGSGNGTPPAPLPPMTDRCDLVLTLDNKRAEVELTIPAVINECGVIPWTPALSLDFNVHVSQENNRLRSWGLYYTKGINPTIHYLDSGYSNNGLPGTVNKTVPGGTASPSPGTGMLANLNSTCAFALKLYAYAHVRDGRHFIYYTEEIKAIAIEKCSSS